jgi:hypothetical protein
MNHRNPDLNIRYAVGMGDFIASILHSKSLSWLVKILTGNNKPCTSCSKRRQALNLLFPIKFWKIFFKNEITYLEDLKNFYVKCGFNASVNYQNKYVTVSKFEEVPIYPKNITNTEEISQQSTEQNTQLNVNKLQGYIFLSSNEVTLGDHLVKIQYYKKI